MSKQIPKILGRQLFVVMLSISLLIPAIAQRSSGVSLPNQEIQSVINRYKTDNPAVSVMNYIRRMPAPVCDEAFRRSIHASLPAEFLPHVLNDPVLTLATRRAIAPVLDLYNRTQVYNIVLLDHPVPLLMSDSGVLLCLTTGLLRRIESEDELLGYIAHEIAHEWSAKRTVETRKQYEKFLAAGALAQADQAREKLGVIELEADAFASLTLAYLGRSPLEYARSLQRVAAEYKNIPIGNHPPEPQRAQVITSVVPERVLNLAPRKTAEFIALKEILAKTRD
jgi:hypothetical protein